MIEELQEQKEAFDIEDMKNVAADIGENMGNSHLLKFCCILNKWVIQ